MIPAREPIVPVADPASRLRARSWITIAAAVVAVASLIGIPALSSAPGTHAPVAPRADLPVGPSSAAPAVGPAAAEPAASPAVMPTPSTFKPPCYPIDVGICVSTAVAGESDIIPHLGSFVASVQPNSTSDIPLVVKSRVKLDWPAASHTCTAPAQKSPICLNVSSNLWNGDPYFAITQGDYWHAANPANVWNGPQLVPSNGSGYIYWYNVTISAKASNGVRLFFPGETVTWWIEITYNVSFTFVHHEGPHFLFTYSGAWPYSPYPGSNQYAGASATFQDIALTVTPRAPNWNDSVALVLNTTQADVVTNATIGSGYVDLVETDALGSTIQTGVYGFPVSIAGGFGATSTKVTVPATYAQVAGATVSYWLTVYDVAGDQVTTPIASWVVGGNGSFLSGVFVNDLVLTSDPSAVIAGQIGSTMLGPGQYLNLTLTSRNEGTAISSAEIVAQVSFPILHETATITRPMHRVSSTIFVGSIQGMPIAAFVNFTVLAWDFGQRLEVSPEFGHYTPDLNTYDPNPDPNSTFFYIAVYDNGSERWVDGAKVQVTGPGSAFNSVGNTTLGLAYPNQTRNVYVPLLLSSNASYTITVVDPYFVPKDGAGGVPVTVAVVGLHEMINRQTLAQGSDYLVVQEANQIVFWLNTTPPPPVASPSVPNGTAPVAAIIGLVAITVAAIPLALWWRQIRARRKEEEKRVTL